MYSWVCKAFDRVVPVFGAARIGDSITDDRP